MLARRLTTILPAMTLAEAIETTRIHRVAGLTGDRAGLVTTRPCRAPHLTISDAGLIGGGHVPILGEVSLAHQDSLSWGQLPMHRPPSCLLRKETRRSNKPSVARIYGGLCVAYEARQGRAVDSWGQQPSVRRSA